MVFDYAWWLNNIPLPRYVNCKDFKGRLTSSLEYTEDKPLAVFYYRTEWSGYHELKSFLDVKLGSFYASVNEKTWKEYDECLLLCYERSDIKGHCYYLLVNDGHHYTDFLRDLFEQESENARGEVLFDMLLGKEAKKVKPASYVFFK